MANCANCAGKGQVVEPVHVWDNSKKQYVIIQRAVTCSACGGKGKV